jgi:hypothetical protein
MTTTQFIDIMIFHELAQFDGAIGTPDNPKVEKTI